MSHIYLCVLAFGILVSLIIFFNHDIKNCMAYSPIEFPAPVMETIKNYGHVHSTVNYSEPVLYQEILVFFLV